MADKFDEQAHARMTMGAKQYFFAARAFMEEMLRPFDIGSMQWYILGTLINRGSIDQRELGNALHVTRATLSDILITMANKGLISQSTSASDQRQKIVKLTSKGKQLWASLPDPAAAVMAVAFEGVAASDLAMIQGILLEAAERLQNYENEKQ